MKTLAQTKYDTICLILQFTKSKKADKIRILGDRLDRINKTLARLSS